MVTTTSPARVRARRSIAADPTSTALLLAGPTGLDLWPGLHRVGDGPGGGVAAVLTLPHRSARLEVLASAPRRTPTSYVTRFCARPEVGPEIDGLLVLAYAPGRGPANATDASLRVDHELPGPQAARLRDAAQGFLDNLAEAAELRAAAA